MLAELRTYLDRNGIGAIGFACRHYHSCRRAGGTFTTAKESYIGPHYERGTLRRLLFLSLDSGSAEADPGRKTVDAVRASKAREDVMVLPRGKHWYETHELAWVLLQQFKPDLKLPDIGSYFAHVNSAKCCMNNPQRRQASDVLFDNCRQFIPGELEILRPDIIVTQGAHARRAVEKGFRIVKVMQEAHVEAQILRVGPREAIWIHTHHPSAYGLFWRQKRDCWQHFATLVGRFVAAPSAAAPSEQVPRLVRSTEWQPAVTTNRPDDKPATSDKLPRSIEDVIVASRTITSPSSLESFVRQMRAQLPGPQHQHQGLFTGMRVQRFQNWQLDENARYRLTDAQLLGVMRVEFPQATGKVFIADIATALSIVSGIRADYNRTGHTGETPASRGMPPSTSYGRF